METTAQRKDDGGYVLNGSKTWISNSPVAWVGHVFCSGLSLTGLLFQGCVRRVGALQMGQSRARVPFGKGHSWAAGAPY
jgi:hypothetical protein